GAHQNSVVSLATVPLVRMRALIESAAFIARPTARALGIFEFARMLSFWRSVSVSRLTVWPDLSEPQANTAQRGATRRIDFMARNDNNLPYSCNSTCSHRRDHATFGDCPCAPRAGGMQAAIHRRPPRGRPL